MGLYTFIPIRYPSENTFVVHEKCDTNTEPSEYGLDCDESMCLLYNDSIYHIE